MPSLSLWPFQISTVRDGLHAYRDGAQSLMIVAPTGSGKTVMGSELVKILHERRQKKAIFFAHRREIVMQSAKKLEAAGLVPEIVMDGFSPNPWGNVMVGSVQTIWSRKGYNGLPEADFVVVDEAHRIGGNIYDAIFKHYKQKGARILLLTATPLRGDGRGLKQYADVMVSAPPVSYLMRHGFLVPRIDYRVGVIPSEKGLKTVAGEWNQAQVASLMDSPDLIGDITATWMHYGRGKKTMCFAAGVDHSLHIVEQFKALGIRAVHVDGDTPKEQRDSIYEQSESGEIEIISSADVYTEGTDFPWVDCIIHAKKWKSLVKYLQQGGRGMRSHPGKESLLFLDHSGVVYRHGRLELDREWELTDDKEQAERMSLQRLKKERAQVKCPQCGFLLARAICGHCGFHWEPKGAAKKFLPGILLEMPQGEFEKATQTPKKKAQREYTMQEKQEWYSSLITLYMERGKPNAVAIASQKYREKFGVWPNQLKKIPGIVSLEVRAFDRQSRMKFAESQEKGKASA